ncbi:PqiC family protein [Pseudocolwellia sp. HL-MZ19]|uniref:PqiC family protein n=1 Tax=unclassified Pseudocolwellia TaxID=2848178 RepID=UPI003CF7392D
MKTYLNMLSIKKLTTKKPKATHSAFNKASLIALALIGLGCSSTEVGLQYYSLNAINSQSVSNVSIENNEDNTFVALNNVEMADFLNTGGLVMQIDSHQIHISNQHLWGDKLPKAIETHLITSLSNKQSKVYVEHKNTTNSRTADKHLTLYFEQFTVTNQTAGEPNETVISGSYIIETKAEIKTDAKAESQNINQQRKHRRRNNAMESKKAFFDIRQPLTQDGYNHAVESFKASLNRLSAQIQKDLSVTD